MKRKQVTQKRSILDKARARYDARAASKRPIKIGFLIDATGSRGETWEQAQVIQAKMFKATLGLSTLRLRLVHYGGNMLSDLGWEDDVRKVAAHMTAVRCVSGLTQINEGLQAFMQDAPEDKADAVILIGDCFEEDSAYAGFVGSRLKSAGIKVFSFIEGDDLTATVVFKKLADDTDGKFARFGADLPLADLCEGVALLTSGGTKALGRLKNKKARLLLTGPSAS
jgi:hypothetical protein